MIFDKLYGTVYIKCLKNISNTNYLNIIYDYKLILKSHKN